jgi:23S rRNA (adenine2503-C2)-methyltransferase
MQEPARKSILQETPESLKAALEAAGQAAFRAKQVLEWVYRKRVGTFAEMTNLPRTLQAWLDENYELLPSKVALVKRSSDITEKLLIEGKDRALIETVLIRYPQEGVGQESSRRTICVSSQVGCAYGCKFCASGLAGYKRNLSAAEILAQLIHVARLEDERSSEGGKDRVPFDNIVFMGMGEPLANYDNLVTAIRALNAEWGLHFGARRVTVSTSGLVPQIRKLAKERVQVRLALSLHGATNAVRETIMPVNRKYPLEELIPAVKAFSENHGRMITLEYILIEEINDSFEQAQRLAQIAGDLRAHVNLIPYNRVEGLPWKRPNIQRQQAFARHLKAARVSHTIRKEKGHDIDAACGQLRLQTEKARTSA